MTAILIFLAGAAAGSILSIFGFAALTMGGRIEEIERMNSLEHELKALKASVANDTGPVVRLTPPTPRHVDAA